jgi:hypothetical protein
MSRLFFKKLQVRIRSICTVGTVPWYLLMIVLVGFLLMVLRYGTGTVRFYLFQEKCRDRKILICPF